MYLLDCRYLLRSCREIERVVREGGGDGETTPIVNSLTSIGSLASLGVV